MLQKYNVVLDLKILQKSSSTLPITCRKKVYPSRARVFVVIYISVLSGVRMALRDILFTSLLISSGLPAICNCEKFV